VEIKEKLLVSICMLTYNHERYVKEAIEGILFQEFEFCFELLIADDVSNDSTEIVIKSIIESHPKGHLINYRRNSVNLGVAANFKQALEACQGKYIALCEGDDVWVDPLKLRTQVGFLENNHQFIGAFHDSQFIDSDSKPIYGTVLKDSTKKNLSFNNFISGNFTLTTQSVIFRNPRIELPNQFLEVENPDIFLYTYLSKNGDFHFHNDIKESFYRLHGTSYFSTRSKFERVVGNRKTFLKMRELYPGNDALEKAIFLQTNSLLVYAFKNKKYKLGFSEYLRNFKLALSNWNFMILFGKFHFQTPYRYFSNLYRRLN